MFGECESVSADRPMRRCFLTITWTSLEGLMKWTRHSIILRQSDIGCDDGKKDDWG